MKPNGSPSVLVSVIIFVSHMTSQCHISYNKTTGLQPQFKTSNTASWVKWIECPREERKFGFSIPGRFIQKDVTSCFLVLPNMAFVIKLIKDWPESWKPFGILLVFVPSGHGLQRVCEHQASIVCVYLSFIYIFAFYLFHSL